MKGVYWFLIVALLILSIYCFSGPTKVEAFTVVRPWHYPYFNHIFVINLENTVIGKKRWKRLQNIEWLSPHLNRFPGIYGKEYDFTREIQSRVLVPSWDVGTWRGETKPRQINMSQGELGVALSHRKLWKHIVSRNFQSCLILEDDALNFSPDFQEKCIETMQYVPKDWDVVLFGFWLHRGEKGYPVNSKISRVMDFCLLHCYAISQRGARKLINLTPIDMPLDTWMSNKCNHLNIYRHNEILDFQKTPKSRLSRQGLFDKQNINTNNI
jgi:GR25 family glycosyltransferase involved in LPS biosynthesis